MISSSARPGGDEARLSLTVCEQAMDWWLEVQCHDVDPQTLAAIEQWRAHHPHHELAWRRAESLASRLTSFRQSGDAELAKQALLSSRCEGLGRRGLVKCLALLMVGAGTAWSARDTALVQGLSADYSTGIGEQRRVTLDSQLHVQLNTRSAMNARLLDKQWDMQLLKGEMLLTQTSPASLRLETAQIQASATAARFGTRLFADGTTLLAVYQGTLDVNLRHAPTTVNLGAGQQALFTTQEMLERRDADPTLTAWSEGMIVAHGQPLSAFLENVSRYRQGHLGCDAALAERPVWGTYPVADSERIIEAVAETLNLDVQRFTRLWVNLRPRRGNA